LPKRRIENTERLLVYRNAAMMAGQPYKDSILEVSEVFGYTLIIFPCRTLYSMLFMPNDSILGGGDISYLFSSMDSNINNQQCPS
jgi:hypothetical protein